MLSPRHRTPLAVPKHRLSLIPAAQLSGQSDGQVSLQPACARCTLSPSHTCMAERALTLRPALTALEISGWSTCAGLPSSLCYSSAGWVYMPLSKSNSHKISKTVFPLQTDYLLFFLKTWVHLRLPKIWTCRDICVILNKACVFACNGKLNCQEIIVKTLCCFPFYTCYFWAKMTWISSPYQCKSELSSQSYGEQGS